MEHKISVVIPFYRRQAVFKQTLGSVLNQTIKPLEIIVVDDASGGDAIDFLNQFKPTIKVIALDKNGGVSNARNIGASVAVGDYIAFLDSDDIWLPTKLEKQIQYFQDHPDCGLVHTGTVNFYPDGREEKYINKPLRLSVKDLIQSSHVCFPCVMVKRQVYQDSGGFDISYKQTEDYEFSWRLVTGGINIDFIPEVLLRVRQGSNDKISRNGWGFIKGHIGVVWRYRHFYYQQEGRFALLKHAAKYLIKGGYKLSGFRGKTLRIIGRMIYPPVKV